MWVMWDLILVHLETELASVQDRHVVCIKLFWTHLMVLLGDEAQVDAHFGLFGDRANPDSR
jgi:hypothetical protein